MNNIIYGIIFYILFGIIGVVIILLKKKYPEYKKNWLIRRSKGRRERGGREGRIIIT